MSLPWVRIDSHIATHPKILALLSDPSSKRWQAAFSYVSAIGWSVDHGEDGRVPAIALPFVHGTAATARLLVTYRLWSEASNGWEIVNFAERQQLDVITAGKQAARRVASEKANCTRHHGPGCWTGTHCPILSSDSESDSELPFGSHVRTDVRTDGDVQDVALSGSLPERVRAPRRDSRRRVG